MREKTACRRRLWTRLYEAPAFYALFALSCLLFAFSLLFRLMAYFII